MGSPLSVFGEGTRVGQPIEASALHDRCDGSRRLITDAIGAAIAELLPPEYRGVYGAGR